VEAEKIDVGWVDPGITEGAFTHSLASCVGAMSYFGCLGEVRRASSSRPNASRNMIAREFLEGDAQWIWWVDADMVFKEQDHPMRLWSTASEHQADMVSGLNFIFYKGAQPTPSMFLEQDGEIRRIIKPVPEEATEIRACGLASVLIHRRVFEAMEAPRHESHRWFDDIMLPQIPKNEGIAGEDVQFFIRATDLGFKLMIDPNATTQHIKKIGVGLVDYHRFWDLHKMMDGDNIPPAA
jgi:hypothetical protein